MGITITKDLLNPQTNLQEEIDDKKDESKQQGVVVNSYNMSFQPDRTFFDSMNFTNIYTDPMYKYTKYDVTPTRFIDWDETRAQNQSTGEQWLNGLTKAGVTTLGAIAENTLGVLFGLGELVTGGAYYDNWIGHKIDGANEWMREAMPNYMTQAEREYTTGQKLGTANFWADTVANGFGYSLGSIATMALTGGVGLLTRGASLVAKGARAMSIYNTTKNIVNAAKIGEKLAKGSRMAGFKNAVGTVEAGVMMSLAESSVEARETQRNVYEDLVNKALIENNLTDESQLSQAHREELLQVSYAAGNRDFLTQLPILAGTNLLMFGRHIAGFKAANKVNKDIAYNTATKKVVNSVAKQGKYRQAFEKVRPTLGGMATEAGQEGWQFASKIYSSDYHTNKYYNGGAADLISSMNKGITDLFGTQEGLESMLVGALVGGGMSGGRSIISKPYAQRKKVAEYAEAVVHGGYFNNAADKALNLNAMSVLVEKMESARKSGDLKTFKDAQYQLVQIHALSNIENGTFDVMMQKLSDTKGLSDEDFAKLYGFDPEISIKEQTKTENNPEGKSKSDIIEQFRTKLNEFKTDYEKVNELFPPVLRSSPVTRMFMSPEEREAEDATFNERNRLRKQLILSVSGIKDRNKRLKSIQEKMQTILADAAAINGTPINKFRWIYEEGFDIGPIFEKDDEFTEIPDVEKKVVSREKELEAVRKKLSDKAIELQNSGALASTIPFANEAHDYLSLYAKNLKTVELYNKLASDEHFRKFFNDALEEKESAARQKANDEANEKNIKDAKEAKDVQVSDDASQAVKNKADKKKRDLKDKEDRAAQIWLNTVKKLSLKDALIKLVNIDPTGIEDDHKRVGLQRAISIIKNRIDKANKKDPRKKPKTSKDKKVEDEVNEDKVVEEMDLEPTEEEKIIEEMNLGEEPEDALTINESNIILDENKENTKKKTPSKRPVKDPDQLDLFTEEGEVVPDKPVSEDELKIQLATNSAEVVITQTRDGKQKWNIPVDEDGNIVEPDPDTVTESVEKPRYQDNRVPVKREEFTVTDADGNVIIFRATTHLDGSVEWKMKAGDMWTTATVIDAKVQQRDNISNEEAIKLYTEIKSRDIKTDELVSSGMTYKVGKVESYDTVINPKMWDRLTADQQNRIDPERAKSKPATTSNPILLNKDLLLDDNIIGTEVEFEIIENDWYLSDREDKTLEPWMEIPIYVKIGDEYIGKLKKSENEERKAIVEKLQKGEKVTTNINSIRAKNFNNTKTVDNIEEVVFRDPKEVFGNNDDILLVHTKAMTDGDVVTSQWSLGEVHPDKDKGDLNKIKVNIEEDQDVQQNQIGIVIRSKHNPQPIDRIAYLSTANLSDNAKLKVLEALESRDFNKAVEIVASSRIRKEAENNPSFLEFGAFAPIKDKAGKTISGEDWMIYYSPALGKLIRIKETELVKAFNGNKAYFNEVKIGKDEKIVITNKYNTDLIDIDIKKDISNFLETKKYNVIRDGANLKGAYISPVTGYEYATYQDYLFDEKEIGEERTYGRGHHSILSTDIIKKGESMFNNPEVKFGKGNVLEDTAPEIIKKAKIDKTKPAAPLLTKDIIFHPQQFTTIAFDKKLGKWIMIIDSMAQVGGEKEFEKDGWTYVDAPWLEKERRFSRYTIPKAGVKYSPNALVQDHIVTENISKDTYEKERGDLNDEIYDTPKEITFEDAKWYWDRLNSGIKAAQRFMAEKPSPEAPVPTSKELTEMFYGEKRIEEIEEIERRRQAELLDEEEEMNRIAMGSLEEGGDIYQPESQEEQEEWEKYGHPLDNKYQKNIDAINAKYDAELAALKAPAAPIAPTVPITTTIPEKYKLNVRDSKDSPNANREIENLKAIGREMDETNMSWQLGNLRHKANTGQLVVDIILPNGKSFLMYRSTGKGTTADTKGLWTPIPGFAKNGWYIKMRHKGVDPKKNKYEIEAFKDIATDLAKIPNILKFEALKTPSAKKTKTIKKSDNSQINDLFDNLGGIDPATGKPRIC